MPINDLNAYMNSLWDWSCLDGCWGNSRVRPTDIDAVVERRGQFLFIEGKNPGVIVPTGQQILFNRLVKHPEMTVLFVWGPRNKPQKTRLLRCDQDDFNIRADMASFRALASKWWDKADARRW